MNLYHVLLLTFISCGSLHGSHQVLKRTFSTNPGTDLFKCAIQKDDVEGVKPYIGLMPLSIEYQYAYLGLSGSLEMSTYMLDAMYINWLARIQNSPRDALVSLAVGLERLLKSFPLDSLDHGFRCMLARIKREVLRISLVDGVEHQELVNKIPEYADEHNLEMAIAYSATFQTAQQVDLLLALSKVHRATRGALPLHVEEAPC